MMLTRSQNTISLITKPLTPPWHDGSRLLPRYLVSHSTRSTYHVMTASHQPLNHLNAIDHPVYLSPHRTTASLVDKLRVMKHVANQLIHRPSANHHPPFHFFFTPNATTSKIFKLLLKMNSKRPTIQTITSKPHPIQTTADLLFTDTLITVSNATRAELSHRTNRPIQQIYPGIPDPVKDHATSPPPLSHDYIIYPGDLAFADCLDNLKALAQWLKDSHGNIRLVIASRWKTSRDQEIGRSLERQFGDRLVLTGTTSEMLAWLAGALAVVFPVRSLFAKMDIPLVLLEAMALGKPLILSHMDALPELGTGMSCDPNAPTDFIKALDFLLTDPDALRNQGLQSRHQYETRFTAARMASDYESLYSEIVCHG